MFEKVKTLGSVKVNAAVPRFLVPSCSCRVATTVPPLVPVAWEYINDVYYKYVKGHNPKDYFGIYDVVRFDTHWLDKA